MCSPWAGLGDVPDQAYEDDAGRLEQWLGFASEVLYELTRRRWPGVCTTTVRPCASPRFSPTPTWWPGDGRGATGTCSCNRSAACGCHRLSEVRLADNVLAITEVRVDGVVVPSTEYGLADRQYLVGYLRADGEPRAWPCCQRLDLEDTAEGTWSVTFQHGGLPPMAGTMVAASLGAELNKANSGGTGCRLPKRVTQVVRQNVAVAVLDPLTLFQEGRTGLPEVDLWLAAVNKGANERPARLSWPGRAQRTRRMG